MKVGVIGLGLLGRALTRRLTAAGHDVEGYDIAEAACHLASSLGVRIHADAASVAQQTNNLFLSLLTSDDRRRLLWGDQALANALTNKHVLLDTTTGRPSDLEADSARLGEVGARLIDVCISGSSQVVEEHRALALVGDSEDAAASYRDLLEAVTAKQMYFEKPGQGCRAKLIVNTVFGLNRLVLAEALGLAAKNGFDLNTMLDLLRQGETYSTVMDTKGPMMTSGVYEPAVARLDQHAKDVDLILELAAEVGADVPVSTLHASVLALAIERGAGPLDNAAVFKAYS
jgi:3-hydroxyisobutyrate dehydrogenase-like beta-hydroxyacid dehydrogenase